MTTSAAYPRALSSRPASRSGLAPAQAADEPDLIFKRSTVFKWLTPNDKLATYGLDDPEVEGVACHFTVPERGGLQGLDRRGRRGVGHLAGLPPDRADPLQGKFAQGEDMFRQRRSMFFKKMQIVRGCDAKRNVLVYMVYSDRPDRRLAEELDLVGADHALGRGRLRWSAVPTSWRSSRPRNAVSPGRARAKRVGRVGSRRSGAPPQLLVPSEPGPGAFPGPDGPSVEHPPAGARGAGPQANVPRILQSP